MRHRLPSDVQPFSGSRNGTVKVFWINELRYISGMIYIASRFQSLESAGFFNVIKQRKIESKEGAGVYGVY